MVKPKIYGTCPAGCLWETVHKEDFLKSAAYYELQPADDGFVYLEKKKLYKIFAPLKNGVFDCAVVCKFHDNNQNEDITFELDLPKDDQYAEYFTFRCLAQEVLHSATDNSNFLTVVYEMNGVRYKLEHGVANSEFMSQYTDCALYVESASGETRVVAFNEDATVKAEDGKSAYEIAVDHGFEGTEEEWLDSLHGGGSGSGGTDASTEKRISDLEKTVAELTYVPMAINSFTVSPSTAEKGESVGFVNLSWSLNKAPATLKLDGLAIDVNSTTANEARETTKTTWTLEAVDESGTVATKNATLSFLNGVYYGVASEPAEYNSAFILGLTKNLRSSKLNSFTANAQAGEYIYYCLPVSMGACSFKVGGFDGGFSLVDTVSFTNAHGHTENYYIYKSDNAGLGSTSVTVS